MPEYYVDFINKYDYDVHVDPVRKEGDDLQFENTIVERSLDFKKSLPKKLDSGSVGHYEQNQWGSSNPTGINTTMTTFYKAGIMWGNVVGIPLW